MTFFPQQSYMANPGILFLSEGKCHITAKEAELVRGRTKPITHTIFKSSPFFSIALWVDIPESKLGKESGKVNPGWKGGNEHGEVLG